MAEGVNGKMRKLYLGLLAEHFCESDVGEDRLTHKQFIPKRVCPIPAHFVEPQPFKSAHIGENTTLVRKKNSNVL